MDTVIRVPATDTQSQGNIETVWVACLPMENRPTLCPRLHLSWPVTLLGKGAMEAVTPWRTVLRVSLLLYPAGAGTGGTHPGTHPCAFTGGWVSSQILLWILHFHPENDGRWSCT